MKKLFVGVAAAAFIGLASGAQAQAQSPSAPKPEVQRMVFSGTNDVLPPVPAPPIDAERPGFTNGTGTVPSHHVQVEAGYLFTRASDGTREHRIGDSALLRVATGANTEVRFGLPTYFFTHVPPSVVSANAAPSPTSGNGGGSDNTHGWGDTSFGAKWRFLDAPTPRSRPSLALIVQTTLPSGEPAYRETHLQPQIALEASYDLSETWNIQSDFVYARPADGGQVFTQYAGGLNLSHNLTEATGVFLETYRISPTGAGAPGGNYLDGGVTYLMKNNTQFDFNLGTGIASPLKNDRFVGVGVAHRW